MSRIKAMLTAEKKQRSIDLSQGSKLFFYTTRTKVPSVLKIIRTRIVAIGEQCSLKLKTSRQGEK